MTRQWEHIQQTNHFTHRRLITSRMDMKDTVHTRIPQIMYLWVKLVGCVKDTVETEPINDIRVERLERRQLALPPTWTPQC